MDKDKGSIGALRNPPPVTSDLFYISLCLDFAGIVLLSFSDIRLAMIGVIYPLVSRMYSWRGIRLKKYPISGWLVVVIFQGAFTFMLAGMAAEKNISADWFTPQKIECLIISTLLIGAYYPLTQIYQHKEDEERGDRTISLLMGIKGTFIFSALLFLISFGVMFHYLLKYRGVLHFEVFILTLLPAIIFFLVWMLRSFMNQTKADFTNAMRMTLLSSTCLLLIFSWFLYANHV